MSVTNVVDVLSFTRWKVSVMPTVHDPILCETNRTSNVKENNGKSMRRLYCHIVSGRVPLCPVVCVVLAQSGLGCVKTFGVLYSTNVSFIPA